MKIFDKSPACRYNMLMDIENDIFKRARIDFDALEPYGFVKTPAGYVCAKEFMSFRAEISIDKGGKVSGKVYDMDTGEEYNNFRIEKLAGGFAGAVRDEYVGILRDIEAHCCKHNQFIGDQANRISNAIKEKYQDEPIFPWAKYDGYGVFKSPKNKKWYAIIMNIDKCRIDKSTSGEVEVMNVKVDPGELSDLLLLDGIYTCYHMDKKHWVTVILDDTLPDDYIMQLICKSHRLACEK